ncbi:sentrin-specific protease 1-like [Corticium candelabrum]|uniref:sentrin-specific protease 1-like n=1 Tax=Corticium candelabrum TaxID=121492 RepID=UPI002E267384|nr:sentrin-specific protease 1-like [Corticium candelabrum]
MRAKSIMIKLVDSLFMEKYKLCGYDGVSNWKKQWTLSDNEKLLFVINDNSNHWTLMVGEPKKKTMMYYDSLGGNGKSYFEIIQNFLMKRFESYGWSHQVAENIPHQFDGYDCGVFLCEYARCVMLQKPMDFLRTPCLISERG